MSASVPLPLPLPLPLPVVLPIFCLCLSLSLQLTRLAYRCFQGTLSWWVPSSRRSPSSGPKTTSLASTTTSPSPSSQPSPSLGPSSAPQTAQTVPPLHDIDSSTFYTSRKYIKVSQKYCSSCSRLPPYYTTYPEAYDRWICPGARNNNDARRKTRLLAALGVRCACRRERHTSVP